MGIELPDKKGESVVVWESSEEEEVEGSSRIVMISDGKGCWTMETVSAYPLVADDGAVGEKTDDRRYVWEAPGSVTSTGLSKMMVNLLLALRGYDRFCLRPDVSPDEPSITDYGENVVAKTRGNRRLIVENLGSSYDGDMILSIRTNKPLDPGHWIAALGNLAKAIDAYEREFYDG